MIKNFETYINEKFDYTKQLRKYKNFKDLKVGDNIYYYNNRNDKYCDDVIESIGELTRSVSNTYQVFYMKYNDNIEVCVNTNGIETPIIVVRVTDKKNKSIYFPASTDKELLIDWVKSDMSVQEFMKSLNL